MLQGVAGQTLEPQCPRRTSSLLPGFEVNERLLEPDTWFTLEMIAEGKRIVIRVNDKVTVDTTEYRPVFTGGHFALQHSDPGTVVLFRKIEVNELK